LHSYCLQPKLFKLSRVKDCTKCKYGNYYKEERKRTACSKQEHGM
jgi:hypothetical protein